MIDYDYDSDDGLDLEAVDSLAVSDGQPHPQAIDLYASEQLHARAMIFDMTKPICVSFPPRGTTRTPFGVEFAHKHRLNWLTITCVGNDWMQYPDLEACENAIRDYVCVFPRVLAYGGSHGGFAALLSAAAIGADAVLAISPQTLIGPGCPGGEPRWNEDWSRISEEHGYLFDIRSRLSQSADIFVLFDPMDRLDRAHVRYIEEIRPIKRVLMPLNGHGSLVGLSRLGLSTRLIKEVLSGEIDLGDFQKTVHRERRGRHKVLGLLHTHFRLRREAPRALYEKAAELVASMPSEVTRQIATHAARSGYGNVVAAIVPHLLGDLKYLQEPFMLDQIRDFSRVMDDAKLCGEWADRLWSAAQQIQEAQKIFPEPQWTVIWRVQLASAYMRHAAKDSQAAIDSASLVAAFVPAWDVPTNAALARIFSDFGDPTRAQAINMRLLGTKSPDYGVYFQLAGAAERDNDLPRIAEIWAAAAANGVEPIKVAPKLCKALMDLGKYDDALAALQPALGITFPPLDCMKLQGQCYLQTGAYEKSLETFGRMAAIMPGSAMPLCFSSRALLMMHRYEEALAEAEKALALAPKDTVAQRQWKRAKTLLDRRQAAVRVS